jgi:hypothetical protein
LNPLSIASRFLICSSLALAAGSNAVVLDRIAVIVGKRVIKTSDIDVDLRLTAFLNREPVRTDPDNKRSSAERLIDQEIIRQEIISGGFRRPAESQAAGLEGQLMRDRFGGSEARLRAELMRYGLTESDLREQLLWQLTRMCALTTISIWRISAAKIHKPVATSLWSHRSGSSSKASG